MIDWSRIDIRLAMDWQWIDGLVINWHRNGVLVMDFQIGLGLALNWWIGDGLGVWSKFGMGMEDW